MGDFGQVGAANLWKSGPFFSTGTNTAELVVMRLRMNLRSRLMRCLDGFVGRDGGKRMEWSWPQVVHSICRAQPLAFHRKGGVHTQG